MPAGARAPTPPAIVRPLGVDDRAVWVVLYADYAAFYERGQSPADRDLVWGWLTDAGHPVEALVAEVDGEVVGFAHFRGFPRPLAASTGLYLDDLYVAPSLRGGGVGRALVEELTRIATARGWTLLRWITAADNVAARRLYDDLALATTWVTYDREVPPAG